MKIYIIVAFWGYYMSLDTHTQKKESYSQRQETNNQNFFLMFFSEHDVNQVFQVKRNGPLYINLECGLFW